MSTARNLTQQPQMQQAQNPFADDAAKRQSGVAALGAGLMAMDDSDSDDDEPTPAPRSPPPIAAPRPGYVTKPIDLARPEPVAVPTGRSRPAELTRTPSTEPHPLRAPMTPIQPVFARPTKAADPTVQFAAPIMRGESEDVLIPGRGQKGDDFWRRFSIIAHDDAAKKPGEKESPWLSKTQGGYSRMSRWVWCTGLILLICIVAGTAFGVYFSHTHASPDKSAPRTVGGQAGKNDGGDAPASDATSTPAASVHGSGAHPAAASPTHFVGATNTVARRSQPTGVAAAHHALRHRQNRVSQLD